MEISFLVEYLISLEQSSIIKEPTAYGVTQKSSQIRQQVTRSSHGKKILVYK